MTATWRATQKANRRTAHLQVAAALFAERGFGRVSVDELSAAAGVSGSAFYNHFSGKEELLVSASERLLSGGEQIMTEGGDDREVINRLIALHLDFAITERDIIRIQDRSSRRCPDPRTGVFDRCNAATSTIGARCWPEFDPSLTARDARSGC